MTIDLLDWAQRLKVINVYENGNPTGIVTDKRLYDPTVPGSRAPGVSGSGTAKWPADGKGRGGVKHATVGRNSLNYLARTSADDGRWVSIHYLDPKDHTELPNGSVMDTTYVLFKIVPDGYGCNHAYPASWRGYNNNLNSNFFGVEVENLQNGSDPFTLAQYIKFGLCWAYLSARDRISDVMLVDHGVCAPPGHRTDPWTGGVWDDSLFYGLLWQIRHTPAIYQFWGLPQWFGNSLLPNG